MAHLIYIHGFLSSPLSAKAQAMKVWLQCGHPSIRYTCPLLPPHPDQCAKILIELIDESLAIDEPVYLMGSSMGGFWASYLVERFDLPAVLINPAVDALHLIPQYLYQDLSNYHTDDVYYLTESDVEQLANYDVSTVKRHDNYWLLAQEGDETLNYRLAAEHYSHSKQTIEEGGNHSFTEFHRFHDEAIEFFQQFYDRDI